MKIGIIGAMDQEVKILKEKLTTRCHGNEQALYLFLVR